MRHYRYIVRPQARMCSPEMIARILTWINVATAATDLNY
jgi:hypothetical protein